MSNDKKSASGISASISEKMVSIHSIIILVTVVVLGIVNIVSHSVLIGILMVVAGCAACAAARLLKNKVSRVTRGTILTMAQLAIIIVMSVAKHELHAMFPLMLASMSIGAIYYSSKNLLAHWIIMDVASLAGFIFKDFFYGDVSIEVIIKGIAGLNIGAFLIMYLVKCSLRFISDAENAKSDANELLEKVQQQMNESEALEAQERVIVEQIAEISGAVNISSDKMLDIAHDINAAAESQQQSIEIISEEINTITDETENALAEAEAAAQAANKSTALMNESNTEMQNMLTAYADIEDSSAQIRNIVKTIEDIAFQTNILALNASIEAARAGEAGKGFAVVADEVRNLANKAQEAVSNTAALIDSSLEAVQRGKEIADTVAERMNTVIQTAEQSAVHARTITEMTEKQNNSIAAVKDRMQEISVVIAQTSATAEQSTAIAGEVSENVRKMDNVVGSFRNTNQVG